MPMVDLLARVSNAMFVTHTLLQGMLVTPHSFHLTLNMIKSVLSNANSRKKLPNDDMFHPIEL